MKDTHKRAHGKLIKLIDKGLFKIKISLLLFKFLNVSGIFPETSSLFISKGYTLFITTLLWFKS